MNAESWSVVGTVVATALLVVIPGVVYVWYVLELWIEDKTSYERVMRSVDHAK